MKVRKHRKAEVGDKDSARLSVEHPHLYSQGDLSLQASAPVLAMAELFSTVRCRKQRVMQRAVLLREIQRNPVCVKTVSSPRGRGGFCYLQRTPAQPCCQPLHLLFQIFLNSFFKNPFLVASLINELNL